MSSNDEIIKTENLTKVFGSGKKAIKAVDDVSISIKRRKLFL